MNMLCQANTAIRDLKDKINPRWYPHFHIAPQAGWMNDPNGLCWFNGYYHVFYQHYPYSPEWGPMHWGHARSRDMVHWEHLPVALAPEGAEDKDGCFSGSAVVDNDQMTLIYTGHKFQGAHNEDNLFQVQCLATSRDGLHFQREGMILDTPPDVNHFRDPKVWREGEHWMMAVGARVAGIGEVQLYQSKDLRQWDYLNTLGKADEKMGYMWECPDFFPLADKHILMFSPQGINAEGYHYRNLYQSGYIVGDWREGSIFHPMQQFHEMDHGHDFYAPQSFVAPDGRRIVIGWLAMWGSPMPEKADGWAGMLSLPRTLSLDSEQRLRMTPVKELEALRSEHRSWSVRELNHGIHRVEDDVTAMEIHLELDLTHSTAERYGLMIGKGARIFVDNQAQRLVVERDYPQHQLSGYRSVPLPTEGLLRLHIFIDRSSVEVFVNEGEFTLSSRIYPEHDDRTLSLFSHHGLSVISSANVWLLNATEAGE